MLITLNINDENVQKSKAAFLDFISAPLYRYERYAIDATVALMYSDEEIDYDACSCHIRQSDMLMKLDKNLIAIVFDNVSLDHGIKAGGNLLMNYKKFSMNQNIFCAVTSMAKKENSLDKGEELFLLLRYAIKNKLKNEIVDCYQLGGL